MEFKAKISFLFYSIIFVILLVLVDRIIFQKFFFQIPNYLEWDTSPWYNFLHKRQKIQFSNKQDGILFLGSSVALYSVLPKKIEKKLNLSKKSIKTNFYAHVALSPTDFYYYLEDIISKKPKYIVYLLNPADLQFDHIKSSNYKIFFDENEKNQIYPKRALVKNIYPFEYLKDNFTNLSKKNVLLLLSKSFLVVNRYKEFIKDPINAYIETNFRSNRSYHYYTGVVPKEGIWLKGWTPTKFSMFCEKKFIDDSIFIAEPHTTLKIFNDKEEEIFQKTYNKKAWYKLSLNQNSSKYFFEISPGTFSNKIEPRLFIKSYKWGIRLSKNFCKKNKSINMAYNRPLGLDDTRFLDMTLEEYEKYYLQRLYPKTDKGNFLSRLKMIRNVKIELNHSEFFKWSELEYISKISKILHKNKIKLLILNTPENPLELGLYREGRWYKGYLKFLESLEKNDSITFINKSEFLKDSRYFMDPHHLTYKGAEKFSDEFTNIFLNKFNL